MVICFEKANLKLKKNGYNIWHGMIQETCNFVWPYSKQIYLEFLFDDAYLE